VDDIPTFQILQVLFRKSFLKKYSKLLIKWKKGRGREGEKESRREGGRERERG
jgi:hypothetical protein